MHWFCPDDLRRCINGIVWKYAIAKPSVPTILLIQEGIDLTQKEVTTLKEVGFSFDHNNAWNLFGPQSSNPSSLYVLAINVHNIVRPTDVSSWLTTCGGKKMRRPSVFKITQQHTNNWEVGILLTQYIVFTLVDVHSPTYE
jgi:hypothetical protein